MVWFSMHFSVYCDGGRIHRSFYDYEPLMTKTIIRVFRIMKTEGAGHLTLKLPNLILN